MMRSIFDEKNIVLRAAVISDIHLSYAYHTEEELAENVEKYASVIGDLYCISDGGPDVIMMCGDYCDLGCETQARTFAQSTKAILDGIFSDKKPPKLLIGMGNHDTCWRNEKYSCMSAEEWYTIFDEYGLTKDLSCNTDTVLGNIHTEVSAEGKAYHFLYVETENYAENVFKPETLEWLDKMLCEITTQSPGQYVFVGTHAPIVESGVYGTDVKLEGGAVWATAKNNIDRVLSKYPQVVFFSGHTHFSLELETAVMQKNYTAINVTAAFARDYYNSQYSKFLDSEYPDEQYGMGLYIEADASGNLRIKRINFCSDRAETEITDVKKTENPAYGKYANQQPEIVSMGVKNCRLVSRKPVSVYGDDWILNAPDAENTHLKRYSAIRGNVAPPYFPQNFEAVAEAAGDKLVLTFPSAISERNILYYVISAYDENHEKIAEYKALGNWCRTKNGVLNGKTHMDAQSFRYEVLKPSSKIYTVEVTATDEYGNQSKAIKFKKPEDEK